MSEDAPSRYKAVDFIALIIFVAIFGFCWVNWNSLVGPLTSVAKKPNLMVVDSLTLDHCIIYELASGNPNQPHFFLSQCH